MAECTAVCLSLSGFSRSCCDREKFGAHITDFGGAALGVDAAFPPSTGARAVEHEPWSALLCHISVARSPGRLKPTSCLLQHVASMYCF